MKLDSYLSLNIRSLETQKQSACPTCDHQDLIVFYEVKNVPIHSCLMLPTQKEAMDFPCDDVVLAVCEHCGFITNIAFDSKWSSYAENYEDQQSYSPTFNRFALNLGQRLVDRYNLVNKKIIEIGCSKGDFLLMMCELGNNSGVGIDPAVIPDRVKSDVAKRVRFLKSYYSEEHVQLEGDFICCRHTLEHIKPTKKFIQIVRDSIGSRSDVPVFFEVPDTMRVLKEAAFEDIYYEHCSYFTPGSLARLFQSCNFKVQDLYLDYGNQYLLIEATSERLPSKTRHLLMETVEETLQSIERFSALITEKIDWWLNQLNIWYQAGEKIVIWGSGSKCVAFLTTLNATDKVQHIVDINPHRHGKYIPGIGKEVKSSKFLREYHPDRIIIMNRIYRQEIQEMLDSMAVKATIIALGDGD
jgi:hypothetical protein